MVNGEVRKGDWSAFTDVIYIDFGDERSKVRNLRGLDGQSLSTIDRNAKTSLSATVWTLAGARTLVQKPTFKLDLLAGFRYVQVASELKLNITWDRRYSRHQHPQLSRPDRVGRHPRGQGPNPSR
jgi:hypothetical protein